MLDAIYTAFQLIAQPWQVRIASRASAQQELGLTRDPRLLGVALRRIALSQGRRLRVIEAADALLTIGFHASEMELDLRWTNGDAALPPGRFNGFTGRMELALQVAATTQYALSGEPDRPLAHAPTRVSSRAQLA